MLTCVLLSACAEPPSREMNQAQTAIDAARAAGAEQSAAEEFAAAVLALKQAQEAVGQRDYRRALDQALDSRERAQTAAKQAADQQAAVRGQAQRALSDVSALIDEASARLADAQAARVPMRTLAALHATIANANAAVQEAGAAMSGDDDQAARQRLSDAAGQLRATIAELDAAVTGRSGRPRR
jgi:hypothetical protein